MFSSSPIGTQVAAMTHVPSRCSLPALLPSLHCFSGFLFLSNIGDAQCHLNNNEIPQRCYLPPLYSRRSRFVIYCYIFFFSTNSSEQFGLSVRSKEGRHKKNEGDKDREIQCSGPAKRASMSNKVQKAYD